MKDIARLLLSLVFFLGLPAVIPAHAETVRVLVMDDLKSLSLHFPEDYEIKDNTGRDLVAREEGREGGSINLDRDDETLTGIRIISKDYAIRINEFALTGTIEVKRNDKGLFRIVNELDLEDYTRAVVGEEMSRNWPMEALKAQAVVARTYALYKKRKSNGGGYDLCATVNSQVFTGGAREKERPAQAARDTVGEVLVYDGGLVETLYHSSCGGRTEDASEVWDSGVPYLKERECSCKGGSPYRRWERTLSAEEIEKALNANGYSVSDITSVKVVERSGTGRAKTVRVKAETGGATMKGGEFRRVVGYSRLPSTSFEVAREGGSFVFIGKGNGHGVGLCQWGAMVMAERGSTYREILEHYYPGSMLVRTSEEEAR